MPCKEGPRVMERRGLRQSVTQERHFVTTREDFLCCHRLTTNQREWLAGIELWKERASEDKRAGDR